LFTTLTVLLLLKFEVTADSIAKIIREFDIIYEHHSCAKDHFLFVQYIDDKVSEELINDLIEKIPENYECPFENEAVYRTKLESFEIYFSVAMEERINLESKQDRKLFRYRKELSVRREKLHELLKGVTPSPTILTTDT
jgi:hypothetical protein